MKAAPPIAEGDALEVNVAWKTGKGQNAKTYVAKDMFVDFSVKPIDKSARALSWGAAAVTAAATLYL